jgi:ADP-ribose pyrophosphatase YjhB (NUDIX family)
VRISFSGLRRLIRGEPAGKAQAGAIVIKGKGDDRRILVVTNKEKNVWLFPKGSVKKKETPEQAAEREVKEESGVEGRVVAYVGATEDGNHSRVDYFLVQCDEEKRMKEDRLKKWCTPEQLVELLDAELAELAQRALPEIMRFK